MTYEQIISDLKKKIYAPVYFLQGEEPYYIDLIADYIEENMLDAGEKEFNQSILYGKELDVPTLISYAKRYPMMSNYQVVIVKEAQSMKDLFGKGGDSDVEKGKSKAGIKSPSDLFLEYIRQPMKSTLLVLCYKYKTVDKRTRLGKLLEKETVYFTSPKKYDRDIPKWIQEYVLSRGFRIGPKAVSLLAEYLGNELGKIANETGKLLLNLKPGDEITAPMVEENIGISKDYNIFELFSALSRKNILKANQIVNYFERNPKNNPIQVTIPSLFSFFVKVLTYHRSEKRDKQVLAGKLGVNPYFLSDYESAARTYSQQHCIRNIRYIRDYDLRSKGILPSSMEDGQIIRELVYKILH
ncbi:MAG: DNA polymerase III subunit delta [Bacteroidia bacterium]|nr:DNA polymerase III subunit delta [Bacteroidia bacterium]